MTFDGKVKTDVNKIEEFLEEKLAPPRWASPDECRQLGRQLCPFTDRSKALGAVLVSCGLPPELHLWCATGSTERSEALSLGGLDFSTLHLAIRVWWQEVG